MTDEKDFHQKLYRLQRSGISKMLAEDYEGAIEDLKAGEALDRKNPEILYNIGVCYCRMGLYRSSSEYIEKILELPFEFIEFQALKKIQVINFVHMGKRDEALDLIDAVLKIAPKDEAALSMKGYVLHGLGRVHEAMAHYGEVMEINPHNATAANSLAYLMAEKGTELDAALDLIKNALKLDPGNPAYLDTMGMVLYKKGDDRARQFFSKAHNIAPLVQEIIDHLDAVDMNSD